MDRMIASNLVVWHPLVFTWIVVIEKSITDFVLQRCKVQFFFLNLGCVGVRLWIILWGIIGIFFLFLVLFFLLFACWLRLRVIDGLSLRRVLVYGRSLVARFKFFLALSGVKVCSLNRGILLLIIFRCRLLLLLLRNGFTQSSWYCSNRMRDFSNIFVFLILTICVIVLEDGTILDYGIILHKVAMFSLRFFLIGLRGMVHDRMKTNCQLTNCNRRIWSCLHRTCLALCLSSNFLWLQSWFNLKEMKANTTIFKEKEIY